MAAVGSGCGRTARNAQAVHLPDSDGDGIANVNDQCPDAIEDGRAPEPKDGCPYDVDADGVKGSADHCPDKPETWNGFADDDGCPDEIPVEPTVANLASPVGSASSAPPDGSVAHLSKPPAKEVVTDAGSIRASECKGGNLASCNTLGLMYAGGNGAVRDAKKALRHYKLACDGGDMNGCANAGALYETGAGIAVDPEAARLEYTLACSHDEMVGCDGLGSLYEQGRGVPVDQRRAAALYRQACAGGVAPACQSEGDLRLAGRVVDGAWEDGAALIRTSCQWGYQAACARLQALDGGPRTGLRISRRGSSKECRQGEFEACNDQCSDGTAAACHTLGLTYAYGLNVPADLARAADFYRKAGELGLLRGWVDVGLLTEMGEGTARDLEAALVLYKRACDGRELTGCTNQGKLLSSGKLAGPIDVASAVSLFQTACDGHENNACEELALLHHEGHGVPRDEARAATLLSRACEGGVASACELRGLLSEKGLGAPRSYADAQHYYEQSCGMGYKLGCDRFREEDAVEKSLASSQPRACKMGEISDCTAECNAGVMRSCATLASSYEYGRGVAVDATKAAAFFGQALSGGFEAAAVHVGLMAAGGVGGPADFGKAMSLFQRACNAGLGAGCTNMGSLFLFGHGVAESAESARVTFKQGCDAGDGNGCDMLGSLYVEGRGIKPNPDVAAKLFFRACELGVASGCESYGAMTLRGEGVEADRERGITFLQLSCRRGYQLACDSLAKVDTCQWDDPDDCIRLCDHGRPASCYKIAHMFADGIGVSKDAGKASMYFQKAYDAQQNVGTAGAAGGVATKASGAKLVVLLGPQNTNAAKAEALAACALVTGS